MNNTYVIRMQSITDVLDEVNVMMTTMDKWIGKHSNYTYSIELNKEDDMWVAELNINKDEQKTETTERVTSSR